MLLASSCTDGPPGGDPPRQQEGPAEIDQRVHARDRHGKVAGLEHLHGIATQQFPGGQRADQPDGKGADIFPDHVLAIPAGAQPDQRHDGQQRQRAAAVAAPAERGDAVQHQQVAAEDDEIADRRAQPGGQVGAEQDAATADRQRGEAGRQDAQRTAAVGMGPMLPERQAGTGQQRSNGDEVQGKEIDVHLLSENEARQGIAAAVAILGEIGRETVTNATVPE